MKMSTHFTRTELLQARALYRVSAAAWEDVKGVRCRLMVSND
jgi:hypothetical protein